MKLRINRDVFIKKLIILFSTIPTNGNFDDKFSPERKNSIYITYLLDLAKYKNHSIQNSFFDDNIFGSRNQEKWYFKLLELVVESDIVNLTDDEKIRIYNETENYTNNLFSAGIKILEVEERDNLKIINIINNMLEAFEQIYIKKKILRLTNESFGNYLKNSQSMKSLIKFVKLYSNLTRTYKIEKTLFDGINSTRFILYGSEIKNYLMDNIPKYAKYNALGIVNTEKIMKPH